MAFSMKPVFFICTVVLLLLPSCAHAFGAGNIASISAVEGKNWRHGDIEDMLKTIACIKGHKWTSIMVKRVYFGNWLRDYSQAVDVGTLQKVNSATLRILVWVLSLLSFGYATGEFEVTEERLGVYRPEEHIDNPKGYAENADARKFDQRLRGPVRPVELEIDHETGMKNYISNERGDWATSAGFVKYSFSRSIHFGRMYTNGHGIFRGKTEDLCEALRCLGQGLHTLEDFGAHTNYTELALRELGFNGVFPHTGTATQINLRGHHVFPLVTGTFGMVDFFHSVLGEATDHFTQSEVNEMDNALGTAQTAAQSNNPVRTLISLLAKMPGNTKELCAEAEELQRSSEAQARANEQEAQSWGNQNVWHEQGQSRDGGYNGGPQQGHPSGFDDFGGNQFHGSQQTQFHPQSDFNQQPHPTQQPYFDPSSQQQPFGQQQFQQPHFDPSSQQQHFDHQQAQQPNFNTQSQQSTAQQPQQPATSTNDPSGGGPAATTGLPGMPNFDAEKTIKQIYPILVFRDKVVRTISAIIEKIPGLEALVDKITETLTVFILSLLAPFVRPIIKAVTKSLQTGSSTVVGTSADTQFEPWTDPQCTDPTHSLLSKDHFANILNEPAGNVASEILKYVAPRVLYAWQHPDVPVDQVMDDCMKVFHHPAIRDNSIEVHRNMFDTVKRWVDSRPDRGHNLNEVLGSESVRAGKNLKDKTAHDGHTHNTLPPIPGLPQQPHAQPQQHHHSSGFGNLLSGFGEQQPQHQHQQAGGGFNTAFDQLSHLPIPGLQQNLNRFNKFSNFIPGSHRELDTTDLDASGAETGTGAPTSAGVPHSPLPPPAGYEAYGIQPSGEGYHPPSEGPHQYEYHQSPYYGGGGGGNGAAGDYYSGS